jgi:hypothetical protein
MPPFGTLWQKYVRPCLARHLVRRQRSSVVQGPQIAILSAQLCLLRKFSSKEDLWPGQKEDVANFDGHTVTL